MWQGSPVTREIDVIRNTKCGCKETHPRVLPVNEQQRASVLFVRGIGVTTSGSPTQRGGGDSSCPSGRRSRVVCLRSTQFASQVPSPRGLTFAPDALFAESIHSLANEHFVIPAWLASPDLTTPFSPRWFSSLDSCDASIVTVLLLFSFITAFRSCLVARPAPFLASRDVLLCPRCLHTSFLSLSRTHPPGRVLSSSLEPRAAAPSPGKLSRLPSFHFLIPPPYFSSIARHHSPVFICPSPGGDGEVCGARDRLLFLCLLHLLSVVSQIRTYLSNE